MHFDALCLACMADELTSTLHNGRAQQVLLVDAHSVGIEFYAGGQRHNLLLCADPAAPRVHLVTHKLRRGVEGETPLLLLLRKHVRDAALTAVTQPDPTERVLRLTFSHKSHGETILLAELIGRQANVLLLRPDGRILACLHPGMVGERALLPGRIYAPPPAQAKLPPLDDGSAGYYAGLAALLVPEGVLWKVLVAGVAGMSPTAAREVAWRAAGDAAARTPVEMLAVAQALQELWLPVQRGGWHPGVLEDAAGCATAFAPYPLHGAGAFRLTENLSTALAEVLNAPAASAPQPAGPVATADPYAAQRAAMAAMLRRVRGQVQRRLDALAADEPAPGAAAQARTQAEWLLALASQVEPGQQVLEVTLEDEVLVILLDATLSPVAQAERLFKRAAKLERAAHFIPQRRRQLREDLAFVDQLVYDLAQAANQPEIAAVRAALVGAGLLPAGKRTQPGDGTRPAGPLRVMSAGGFEILVGRNARQNEQVTFKLAAGEDLWLHARGVPGAHVVVKTAGRLPDAATVDLAAQLAAYHSGARGEARVDVIVTTRRHVHRAPGGRIGQVTISEETVRTAPGIDPFGK
jgi:predicted ribosome quality control (RQC) complex YloA/Tae2 family protein